MMIENKNCNICGCNRGYYWIRNYWVVFRDANIRFNFAKRTEYWGDLWRYPLWVYRYSIPSKYCRTYTL